MNDKTLWRRILDNRALMMLLIVLVSLLIGLVIYLLPVPEGRYMPLAELSSEFCSDHEGLRITTEGYLHAPEVMTGCVRRTGDTTCVILLTANPDGGSPAIRAAIEVGERRNQMEALPGVYTSDDLAFRDSSGQVLGQTDRVRVTGILDNTNCRISIKAINSVP